MRLSELLTDLAVLADGVDGTEWVGGARDVAVTPELLQPTGQLNYRTQPDTGSYCPPSSSGTQVHMVRDRQ